MTAEQVESVHTRILEKSIFRIRRLAQIQRVRVNDVTIPNRRRTKDQGPVDRRGTNKPAFVPAEHNPCRPNKPAMRAKGQQIEQIIGSILSADAKVMAKTEIDQVRRCSKIEIASASSIWPEGPPN